MNSSLISWHRCSKLSVVFWMSLTASHLSYEAKRVICPLLQPYTLHLPCWCLSFGHSGILTTPRQDKLIEPLRYHDWNKMPSQTSVQWTQKNHPKKSHLLFSLSLKCHLHQYHPLLHCTFYSQQFPKFKITLLFSCRYLSVQITLRSTDIRKTVIL